MNNLIRRRREKLSKKGVPPRKKLKIRRKRGNLTGVCAGLGEHVGINPVFFRLGFIALSFFSGIGILLYLALSVLIPMEDKEDSGQNGIFRLIEEGRKKYREGPEIIQEKEAEAQPESLPVCPNCDTVSKPNSNYCHKCGTMIG